MPGTSLGANTKAEDDLMASKDNCGGSWARKAGAIVVIVGAVAATSFAVVSGDQGQHDRRSAQSQPEYTIENFLTRDLTYAATSNEANDKRWERIQSQIGKRAPEFRVGEWKSGDEDLKGGSLESMRGEIVVINFWGTWCPPCRAAMPKNTEIARKYVSKKVRFVGVCNTRGSETMMETTERHGGLFATAADIDDATRNAYGVQWWPYYVIVDREGIVRAAGLRPDKIEEAIDRVLAIQPYEPQDETSVGSAAASAG